MTPAARIAAAVGKLEPDALSVLADIAERFVAGRKQYGDLVIATDRRDWLEELAQEMRDALVYIAIEKRRRASGPTVAKSRRKHGGRK